jgi:ATP-dependent protease ClpP protease subunit
MKQGVFLRAMASDAAEAVVDVVGVIGWEVAYQNLRDMLRSIPETVKRVVFDIYSPGGDVWEGNGIVQEIGELGKRCETVARVQVAASMATLIAVACDKRTMAANGRFLIHNAWTQTVGDAAEHEKQAKTLRDAEAEAAAFYASRTGGKPEDMLALMAEERWMMPEEAKALGFVQEICDPFKPEDFAQVKQEIQAAGKWPKALAELPETEQDNADATDNGTSDNETAGADDAARATNEAHSEAMRAEYARGKADGIAEGAAHALTEFGDQIGKVKQALAEADKAARTHQSEKDRLAAQLAAAIRSGDERAATLRAELDAAAVKLKQFVSGALTFAPAIETWAEALASCGGDYARAAARHPQVLEQYRAEQKQKGK